MKTYFYFSTLDKKLRYGDNRPISVGTTHSAEGALKLCANGLHGSVRLTDALRYAPGPYLWLVSLNGEKVTGRDKVCARSRTYLAGFDASDLLREFARKQAMLNIEKIKPYCSGKNYKLMLEFLETGDESLRSAAESAAESAARSAAESAARSAARCAAWCASRCAARSAAWCASRCASRSAADQMLVEMVEKKLGYKLDY